MQQPTLVRAIFYELRATGIDAQAVDVLRLADVIVQALDGRRQEIDEDYRGYNFPRRLPYIAVDKAMNDGGWRVLEFESKRTQDYDQNLTKLVEVKKRIGKVLGIKWQKPFPPG